MNPYTPEPWFVGEGTGGSIPIHPQAEPAYATCLAYQNMRQPREEVEANAARIVACVNGCAGLNPEAMHHLFLACIDAQDRYGPNTPIGRRLRAAIAHAKSEQP